MKNRQCLYLCHMTKEEKKEYNKKYYQENKDYWREYYGYGTRTSNNGHEFIPVELSNLDVGKALADASNALGGTYGKYGTKNVKRQVISQISDQYADILANNAVATYVNYASYADAAAGAGRMADDLYKRISQTVPDMPYSQKEFRDMFASRFSKTAKRYGITIGAPGGRAREKNVAGSAAVKVRDPNKQYKNAIATPDLDARTRAVEQARRSVQEASRQVTPDLNARMKAMSAPYMQVKTSSSVFSKIADVGKSLFKTWKLGWK